MTQVNTSLPPGLIANNLNKSFGYNAVVQDVSFEVHPGEVVGLLGPNGAGKTTSFYMIVGLLKPDNGTIMLKDMDISTYPMYKRARLGISYLPQSASVFRKMTVSDNFLAVMEVAKIPKKERSDLLTHLLQKFQISHIQKSMAYTLSGGERRRVEIARSLIINPSFLLLDEPFAGIDPLAVTEIQNIVEDLKQDGLGILITDHNVRETLGICDRAYVIHQGKIVEKGDAHQIVGSQKVKEIYLGENFSL